MPPVRVGRPADPVHLDVGSRVRRPRGEVMSNFKGWEILIVLVLLLLLFGAKRLPDAARGLGRSMRIFKAETKGLRDDDKKADEAADSHQAGAERPAAPPIQ